ncbi:aminoglycoside phosphotransferase family protein [Nocardioides mesophilus]|uniref:Aminoglycoside phosphotransferase family protein n=1 Tax=Nocardioides mesophilus TaxID=433659 RepID=A0A7G9RGR3_9ACTN|nr:aminoglycoside phosphotransferase family protein [Nocardioides mesophilus]
MAAVPQAPHGRTARRVDWMLLPPMLRRAIEQRIGFPVIEARSAGAGFTPGFASLLVGAAGQRVFVKAANALAQAPFADAYREEVRKLAALPPGLPVPRLLWSMDAEWVVLAMEYVDGENPSRPWQPAQLEACLDTLEELADRLTPAPAAMRLEPMAAVDEFGAMLTGWAYAARQHPDWPHREEAAALAARHQEALSGTTLVHTDARDDNFRITPQGSAVLCDWNWPVLGPAWADSVMLLISVSGEGHDVEEILARRRLTRDVDPEHVDVLLALLCGYFLEARDRPVPNSSPFLRIHQSWYAEASWSWLAARRGWRS